MFTRDSVISLYDDKIYNITADNHCECVDEKERTILMKLDQQVDAMTTCGEYLFILSNSLIKVYFRKTGKLLDSFNPIQVKLDGKISISSYCGESTEHVNILNYRNSTLEYLQCAFDRGIIVNRSCTCLNFID